MEPLLAYGLQTMSIGFMIDVDSPMVWRGPMVTQALEQLLRQTNWKDLDYLVVDLPPGTGDTQLTLAQKVRRHVGGLKLGLEFFCANGHHGVHEMAKFGLPIFLDLKLHDIPNTVAKAIQALCPIEPAILTVHAAGGRAMLEDAKAAAPVGTKIVAVTTLTSLDHRDLQSIGVERTPHDQVLHLTELAMAAVRQELGKPI